MSIKIEVWGDYACFTRPELKTERVSYDIITPSAARGLLESIFWHPGLRFHIDRIHLLSPVSFINVRRNEVMSTISASAAHISLKNGTPMSLYTGEDRQQRAALILKNVHYVIEAHFTMTGNGAPGDNPSKFNQMLKRRVQKGQFYSQPYLGCREFPANFCEWTEDKIPALPVTQDLGFMLYDMDYRNQENIKPQFFRAKLVNGVMDVSDCEVYT